MSDAPAQQVASQLPEHDPRYAWVMVAATFVLSGLAFGVLGSVSVFLKPLAAEFGWTRAETSLGYSTVALSSAFFGVLWGYVADRVGSRWFGLLGAASMGSFLFLMSRQSTLAEFYTYYFLFGALGSAAVYSPLFASVGFWFKRQPGLALGITAAGGAIGQGVVPYLASLAITAYDWQTAYQLMAVAYFVITLPTALLIREAPDRTFGRASRVPPSHPVRISEREVIMWVSIAVIFCCICMALPIVHLVPLLTDQGKDASVAASVLLVLMISGGFGRIAGGKLGDLIGPIPAYMTMSLGQTVFVFWFPHLNALGGFYLLAIAFGFTYSGVMSSILVCTRMMVSPSFGARAMGITSFFGWIGMAMGGYLGGAFFDSSGSYVMAFAFASASGFINLVILLVFLTRARGGSVYTDANTLGVPSS
jgi:MFS family permease